MMWSAFRLSKKTKRVSQITNIWKHCTETEIAVLEVSFYSEIWRYVGRRGGAVCTRLWLTSPAGGQLVEVKIHHFGHWFEPTPPPSPRLCCVFFSQGAVSAFWSPIKHSHTHHDCARPRFGEEHIWVGRPPYIIILLRKRLGTSFLS